MIRTTLYSMAIGGGIGALLMFILIVRS
jgi:hypothetical protein